MNSFIRKITQKQIGSVGVYITESTIEYNLVIAENIKGSIQIRKIDDVKSIADIKEKLPKNTPVCLIVNGKGVITKSLPSDQNDNPFQVFPFAKPAEFELFQFIQEKTCHGFQLLEKTF